MQERFEASTCSLSSIASNAYILVVFVSVQRVSTFEIHAHNPQTGTGPRCLRVQEHAHVLVSATTRNPTRNSGLALVIYNRDNWSGDVAGVQQGIMQFPVRSREDITLRVRGERHYRSTRRNVPCRAQRAVTSRSLNSAIILITLRVFCISKIRFCICTQTADIYASIEKLDLQKSIGRI